VVCAQKRRPRADASRISIKKARRRSPSKPNHVSYYSGLDGYARRARETSDVAFTEAEETLDRAFKGSSRINSKRFLEGCSLAAARPPIEFATGHW